MMGVRLQRSCTRAPVCDARVLLYPRFDTRSAPRHATWRRLDECLGSRCLSIYNSDKRQVARGTKLLVLDGMGQEWVIGRRRSGEEQVEEDNEEEQEQEQRKSHRHSARRWAVVERDESGSALVVFGGQQKPVPVSLCAAMSLKRPGKCRRA